MKTKSFQSFQKKAKPVCYSKTKFITFIKNLSFFFALALLGSACSNSSLSALQTLENLSCESSNCQGDILAVNLNTPPPTSNTENDETEIPTNESETTEEETTTVSEEFQEAASEDFQEADSELPEATSENDQNESLTTPPENHSEHQEQAEQFGNSQESEELENSDFGAEEDDFTPSSNESDEIASEDSVLDNDLTDGIIDGWNEPVESEPSEDDSEDDAFICMSYYDWQHAYSEDMEFFEIAQCDFVTDNDGDGLAKAIDPNDSSINEWFIVKPNLNQNSNYSLDSRYTYYFRFIARTDLIDNSKTDLLTYKSAVGITDFSMASTPQNHCNGVFIESGVCVIHKALDSIANIGDFNKPFNKTEKRQDDDDYVYEVGDLNKPNPFFND